MHLGLPRTKNALILLLLAACSQAAPQASLAMPAPAAPPAPAPTAEPVARAESQPQPEAPAVPRFRRTVQLMIFGSFPSDLIPEIERALREQLQVQVLPTITRALPQKAYYAPRKRYRAEKLLVALEREQEKDISQLGMTEVDISTTKGKHKDWGVFGISMLGGTSSVISTHRSKRDQPRTELYRFRVVSTAVHEVGHMLGLDHCVEARCVMNDAEGSIKNVDDSTGTLGPKCSKLLDARSPATLAP